MTATERIAQLNEKDKDDLAYKAETNWPAKIYDRTVDQIVEPGFYDVIEADNGGLFDEKQFTIEITKPINQRDLALNLYEDMKYMSWWVRLDLRPVVIETKKRY